MSLFLFFPYYLLIIQIMRKVYLILCLKIIGHALNRSNIDEDLKFLELWGSTGLYNSTITNVQFCKHI